MQSEGAARKTDNSRDNIKFFDGAVVTVKDEVEYLGCLLNEACKLENELASRTGTCFQVMRKLDMFWRPAGC